MSAEERQRWTKLPLIDCRHCGAPLYARYDPDHAGSFIVATPLVYAHADGGAECFTRHVAGPYDGYKAAAAYDVAVAVQDEEESND